MCELPGHRLADSLLLRGALFLSAVDRERPRMPGGIRARMPANGIVLETRLRKLGLELGRRIAGRSTQAASKALRVMMADEHDFAGGESSYFSPGSVRLDEVMESRRGIPVSLSILYLLVARWAGLSAAGVRMPDHFLVRIHGVRPVILDPFHRGRQVTKSDCVRYLRSAGYGNATAEYTRDLTDREVLAELCRCLARVYRGKGDGEAVATLHSALAMLQARSGASFIRRKHQIAQRRGRADRTAGRRHRLHPPYSAAQQGRVRRRTCTASLPAARLHGRDSFSIWRMVRGRRGARLTASSLRPPSRRSGRSLRRRARPSLSGAHLDGRDSFSIWRMVRGRRGARLTASSLRPPYSAIRKIASVVGLALPCQAHTSTTGTPNAGRAGGSGGWWARPCLSGVHLVDRDFVSRRGGWLGGLGAWLCWGGGQRMRSRAA